MLQSSYREMIIIKAKEVLELLQITIPTLTKYVKEGLIKVNILPYSYVHLIFM